MSSIRISLSTPLIALIALIFTLHSGNGVYATEQVKKLSTIYFVLNNSLLSIFYYTNRKVHGFRQKSLRFFKIISFAVFISQ